MQGRFQVLGEADKGFPGPPPLPTSFTPTHLRASHLLTRTGTAHARGCLQTFLQWLWAVGAGGATRGEWAGCAGSRGHCRKAWTLPDASLVAMRFYVRLPLKMVEKLQQVQNAAARPQSGVGYLGPILVQKGTHWLPSLFLGTIQSTGAFP